MLDTFVDDVLCVFAVTHRKNHGADVRLDKGAFGKFAFCPRHDVEHFHNRINVFSDSKSDGDGLVGVAQKRVGRVHIQIIHIGNIDCDAAAGEPCNVVECVLQAGEIMEVLKRQRPVAFGFQIKRGDSSAACAKVNAVATHVNVAGRVAAIKPELCRRGFNRTFDHGCGQADPFVAQIDAACCNQILGQAVRHFAHAELGQKPQCGVVNLRQLRLGQWLISPTSRTSGCWVHRNRYGTFGVTGRAATGSLD